MPKYWTVQLAAVMSTSIAMATAFCHLREMFPKMRFHADLWVTLYNRLYPQFGFTGGVAESLALIPGVLVWLLRAEAALRAPLEVAFVAIFAASLVWGRVYRAGGEDHRFLATQCGAI